MKSADEKEKQPIGMFEKFQMNAEKTARDIERTRAKKRPLCSICLKEIGKSDFEAGRFLFTESKASGKAYLCKNCAGMKQKNA